MLSNSLLPPTLRNGDFKGLFIKVTATKVDIYFFNADI